MTGHLPLTPAQRRLWALYRMYPVQPFYNHPFAVEMRGRLDRPALERALTGIVARHPALRTRFRAAGDEVVQAPDPPAAVRPTAADLSDLPASDRGRRAAALADEFAQRPFDLERGPAFRTLLLRLGGDAHRLAVNVHHIVFDGMSLDVFMDELAARYEAEAGGAPLELPAIDYGAYLRERAAGDERAARDALDYWTGRLAGAPAALDLPGDGRGGTDHRAAYRRAPVPEPVPAGLRRLARRHRASLYMVLKAACDATLAQYAGPDILTGVALSGRDSTASVGLIGYLARTVVLRSHFEASQDPSFSWLLAQVRDDVLDAHEHPELPFEDVLRALGVRRDPGCPPLYQVMFAHHPRPVERRAGGITFAPADLPLAAIKADLEITLAETGDGLRAELAYRTAVLDDVTANRMLARLRAVLARVSREPDVRMSALAALEDAERATVAGWSRGPVAEPAAACAHELIGALAERSPDAVAVRGGGGNLTYRELAAAAGALATRLWEVGLEPWAPVGVCLPPSPAVPVAVLGVLCAGAAVLPLDPALPAFQLMALADDAGVGVVLAGERQEALFDRSRTRVVRPDQGDTVDPRDPVVPAAPSTPAWIGYRTPIDDDPSAAVFTHGSLVSVLDGLRRRLPAGAAVPAAGAGDLAVFTMLAALAGGGTVDATGTGSATAPALGTLYTAAGVLPALADGRPLDNTAAYLLDPRRQPVPPGVAGELHLGGAAAPNSFLHRPELTTARLFPDLFAARPGARMYATGDRARHGPDGRIRLLADPAPDRRVDPTMVPVPAGKAERLVAAAWSRVLGHEPGPSVNFFEAGGDSLLLIRLRDQLSDAFGTDIDVVDLFRHATVRAMAALLGADDEAGAADAAVARGRARQEAQRVLHRGRPRNWAG